MKRKLSQVPQRERLKVLAILEGLYGGTRKPMDVAPAPTPGPSVVVMKRNEGVA
jgi:hypothetical protein